MTAHRREPVWRRYLRLVRPDVAADVDDELRFHFEMLVRELEARGLAPAEAAREARRRFGDGERVARWLRAHDLRRQRVAHRRETMSTVAHHVRFATRGLLRQPAFTTAAVLTLALGIGATTAIVGVVDGVLLEPLPLPRPERIVGLWHATPILGTTLGGQSVHTFDAYRRLNRTLVDLALYEPTAVNIAEATRPERATAARVTASFFPVLEVGPLLGRLLTAEDERPGHDVVVIGEGLWRRRFGGSPDVIGTRLRVDGVPREIVGVVADRARFPRGETQLWLPLDADPLLPTAGAFRYSGIGRLRPGVTLDGAVTDLQRVLPQLATLHPMAFPGVPTAELLRRAHPVPVVRPLRDDVVGDIGRVLWVIFGTVGFVLLAACANIANLALVRAESRRGELAVRAALGAGRRDVLARFVVEGLLLATAGATLGVTLAWMGLRALRHAGTLPIPRLDEIGLDGRVLAAAVVVTLLVALVTSALAMLRVGAKDLASTLRTGGRGATRDRDRRRLQRALVVAQVALAFVLLASCALMSRTFVSLREVRPGFDAAHALTFRVAFPDGSAGGAPSAGEIARFHATLADRLARLPGVAAVGASSWRPLDEAARSSASVIVEGVEAPRDGALMSRPVVVASPGFFRALGIPLLAGREFRDLRAANGAEEVIVSAAFAAQVLGETRAPSALGRRIRLMPGAPWVTIIGVVGSVRDVSLEREPVPVVYLPFSSSAYGMGELGAAAPRAATVIVRSTGDPTSLAAAVRREVAALDPTLPVYDVSPMAAVVRRSMARTTFTALLLTIAAAVSLALGAIGLYGVVAYMVGMRRREIGLRVALGARPDAVGRLLAWEGAGLAALGVGVGLVAAVLVTRVLGTLLYGVSATDPLTLAGTALILLVVSWTASWLPARRVARIDPAVVLSAE